MKKDVPQPPEDKKYTIKDIQGAESVGDALHAYRKALSEGRQWEVAGLQQAVAERAHEIGDEQTSKEFTILAAQTGNNERFLRGIDTLVEVSGSLEKTGNRILEASEELKSGAGTIREAISQFGNDVENLRTAGRDIAGAALKINEASRRMG